MSEKKKGLMWKPPLDVPIGDETIKILGFMPLPAALCIMPAYNKDGTLDPKKLSYEMLCYFLKQCVLDPPMDDEYFKNSDAMALMKLFKAIVERVQTSKEDIREIKKTSPIKP